jgi:hypothetical protein
MYSIEELADDPTLTARDPDQLPAVCVSAACRRFEYREIAAALGLDVTDVARLITTWHTEGWKPYLRAACEGLALADIHGKPADDRVVPPLPIADTWMNGTDWMLGYDDPLAARVLLDPATTSKTYFGTSRVTLYWEMVNGWWMSAETFDGTPFGRTELGRDSVWPPHQLAEIVGLALRGEPVTTWPRWALCDPPFGSVARLDRYRTLPWRQAMHITD